MSQRILVVDDDGLVLRSVSKVLERAGHAVITAVDVASALSRAEEERIDAALVDYGLAGETGLAILARLREIQPHCVRILITGRTDFPVVVEAVNRGEVARVLRKPFEGRDLLAALDEALASARRRDVVGARRLEEGARVEQRCLDEALRPGMLSLALQPILSLEEGDPVAVACEALLRPLHPRLATPLALIEAAERHGRAGDVGSGALRLAAASLDAVSPGVRLFVNLHPHQIADPERLLRDLEPLGPSADRVVLEITERIALHGVPRWEETLRTVTERGFRLAVDDLGAGYSSLSVLAELQPDFIKLDMSLVRGIDAEPRKQRLVHLMDTFGRATGARVIAEGVETEDERDALLRCGIGWMQGYLFGRPLPLSDGRGSPPSA